MINIIHAALSIRAQTEKTIFSCKDDSTLTKHTRCWTYSAKAFEILLCHIPPLWTIFKYVSRMLEICFKGVLRVLFIVFQRCLKGVSRMFQRCPKRVSMVFQEYLRMFFRLLSGCFKDVSRKFLQAFKDASMMF